MIPRVSVRVSVRRTSSENDGGLKEATPKLPPRNLNNGKMQQHYLTSTWHLPGYVLVPAESVWLKTNLRWATIWIATKITKYNHRQQQLLTWCDEKSKCMWLGGQYNEERAQRWKRSMKTKGLSNRVSYKWGRWKWVWGRLERESRFWLVISGSSDWGFFKN